MKLPKPHKLKWVSSKIASKWPEGCIVLSIEFIDSKPDWSTLQKHWHRPDLLDENHKNYLKYYAEKRYCLVSLPLNLK